MTYASPQIAEFLSKLEGVKKSGTNWYARCPCRNDDMNPSLSIGQGNDGRVLATCHRGGGCSLDEICDAMKIKKQDLFPKKDEEPTKVKVTSEKLSKSLSLIATYDYRDALGELLFQKQRFVDENGKKTFRQRKPDGNGGWSYQLGEVPRVLYRLPQIANAVANNEIIWVVEGEKDADTLLEEEAEAEVEGDTDTLWVPVGLAVEDAPGVADSTLLIEAEEEGDTVTLALALLELEAVGLGHRTGHYPTQLSGGEQQRVAIARAIAKRPEVLLCDEPTGALDVTTGITVLEAVERINRELGTLTVIITHNAVMSEMADRVLHLSDGKIVDSTRNEVRLPASGLKW
jgi:ABC-type dipeptide/oligopeptide/nickel transport system ATPase component